MGVFKRLFCSKCYVWFNKNHLCSENLVFCETCTEFTTLEHRESHLVPTSRLINSESIRDHIEKARYDLIPMSSLKRLALIYSEGATKYGDNSWKKGMNYSDVLNHAFEHLRRYREGDKSEDNLAKIAWAMFTLMYYQEFLDEKFNDIINNGIN